MTQDFPLEEVLQGHFAFTVLVDFLEESVLLSLLTLALSDFSS